MQTSKEHLLDWLRDAHAMEQQALQMLKGEEGRLESYPELLEKIRENQRVAQQNRDSLKSCIERLGGDSSTIKDLGAQVMGMAQAISGVVFSDEASGNCAGAGRPGPTLSAITTAIRVPTGSSATAPGGATPRSPRRC